MTLAEKIEGARVALNELLDAVNKGYKKSHVIEVTDQALATLPDKPMTEDEIKQIIGRSMGAALMTGVNAVDEVFRVLKAENVLFVKEEKS